MKLCKQTNNFECGVCVLKSIYEYLYKKEIEKETIIENYFLSNNGMSIYDFEILGSKININFDSYNVSFEELKKIKYTDYFVTCIKNDNNDEHFIICKKRQNHLVVYDSFLGIKKMSFDEFEKIYNNILIVFEKKNFKNDLNISNDITKIKFFDLPNEYLFMILLIFLDTLTFVFAFIGSGFLKVFINFVSQNFYSNLVFLVIYFALIYILEASINYVQNILKNKKIEELSKRNIIFYMNILSKKSKQFFFNFSKGEIYNHPLCISKVLTFKYVDKPSFFSDLIFLFILIFAIAFISLKFLFFSFIIAIISVSISYFIMKFNEQNFEKNNFYKSECGYHFHNMYTFLENEKNKNKWTEISKNIKYWYWNVCHINIYNNEFHNKANTIKTIAIKIFFVIVVSIGIVEIIKQQSDLKNISQLIFLITLLNLFESASSRIFDFLADIPNLNKSKKSLKKLITSFNKKNENTNGIKIEFIEYISLKNLSFCYENDKNIFYKNNYFFKNKTLIQGSNGTGKTTLMKILANDFVVSNSLEYLINGIDINKCDVSDFESRICYLPSNCTPCEINFSKLLDDNYFLKDKIIEFIKQTKISTKKINEYSSGEIQLCNLVSLIYLKNHLILLDETFSNICQKNLNFFMEHFFPIICRNNFVIAISHSKEIMKYFDNIVEIKCEK